MKVERMNPEHVRRAIDIYNSLAWPPDQPGKPCTVGADMASAKSLSELRPFFLSPRSSEHVTGQRYTIRLGNFRYPFMKFVLHEYLVEDELFFSVDTHDELHITPDMPDYDQWQEVRSRNAELKVQIEDAWSAEGLPTHKSLREIMEREAEESLQEAEPGLKPGRRGRLLLADDEGDIARGLGAVLIAMGYDVELAFDGPQVLAALAEGPLPDLVVLDFSMPGFTGEEVIERLRQDERTQHLPVLLATATSIDPVGMGGANALLRKPYPQRLLFRIIEDQLGIERARDDR